MKFVGSGDAYDPMTGSRDRLQGLGGVLSGDAWRWLSTAGTARDFDRGDALVRQGQARHQVLVLLDGHVKITRVEVSGIELLLSVRGPGEVLGDMGGVESGPKPRSATAVALRPCRTRTLSVADFETGIDGFAMGRALVGHWAQRFREGELIRAENSLPALQRISALLCRLAVSVGSAAGPDVVIDVGLSQEDLRLAVQLSPSTFGAGVKALRDSGLLSTARGSITVHRLERLRYLADHGFVEQ